MPTRTRGSRLLEKPMMETIRASSVHNSGGQGSSSKSLLHLPFEVLDAIIDEIAIHDMAVLARTSKDIKVYIEPRLYWKMYTRIGTPQDTEGLVNLLQARPEILPIIQMLVLDEHHPRHLRRLLAMRMPRLWCLLIQTKAGDEWAHVSEREKRALNRALVKQPGLTKLVLHKKPTLPPSLEALSKQDACLFNHSRISNLRLSSLDFSPFGDLRGGFLSLPCMNVVWIEDCQYSVPALKNLITSSNCLESITLFDGDRLPVDASQLQPILAHAAPTLKILKLIEPVTTFPRPIAFDISGFQALRLLHIEPCLLLAPQAEFSTTYTYTSPSHPDLAACIRRRLPPNLKILLLEAVTLPHNHVPVAAGQRGAEIERVVHDVPWGEYMAETEELAGLYAFAERMPMRFAALDRTDDVDFAWEWLDWDGDDYRPGSPEPENEGEVDRTGL
ncbi:hypothetical protein XPA_006374 [Xanthoria parietina]